MKIIKNQAKKLKCTEKILIFIHPHPPPHKCMVCTLVTILIFMDSPLVKLVTCNLGYESKKQKHMVIVLYKMKKTSLNSLRYGTIQSLLHILIPT